MDLAESGDTFVKHRCKSTAALETNISLESILGTGQGSVVRMHQSLPQQTTEPSVFTPQVCLPPALTEANLPSGGVASPSSSLPQQATVPSVSTPQVCLPPALTEAYSSPRGSVGSFPPTHAATIAIISSIAGSRPTGRAGSINLQRVPLALDSARYGKASCGESHYTNILSLYIYAILFCHPIGVNYLPYLWSH